MIVDAENLERSLLYWTFITRAELSSVKYPWNDKNNSCFLHT